MKRPRFASPRRILEVSAAPRSSRPDPRADPLATTKISRAELDAVLNRTRSGTRPVVRPETSAPAPVAAPEADASVPLADDLPGPRDDDGPEITIRKIESVEIDLAGNPVLPRDYAPPTAPSKISPISPITTFAPTALPAPNTDAQPLVESIASGTSAAPRRARGWSFSLAVLVFVALVALVGALVAAFFAGRLSLYW